MSVCGLGDIRNNHSSCVYVLVCLGQDAQLLGQIQCVRGREALRDAVSIDPVLRRWALHQPAEASGEKEIS